MSVSQKDSHVNRSVSDLPKRSTRCWASIVKGDNMGKHAMNDDSCKQVIVEPVKDISIQSGCTSITTSTRLNEKEEAAQKVDQDCIDERNIDDECDHPHPNPYMYQHQQYSSSHGFQDSELARYEDMMDDYISHKARRRERKQSSVVFVSKSPVSIPSSHGEKKIQDQMESLATGKTLTRTIPTGSNTTSTTRCTTPLLKDAKNTIMKISTITAKTIVKSMINIDRSTTDSDFSDQDSDLSEKEEEGDEEDDEDAVNREHTSMNNLSIGVSNNKHYRRSKEERHHVIRRRPFRRHCRNRRILDDPRQLINHLLRSTSFISRFNDVHNKNRKRSYYRRHKRWRAIVQSADRFFKYPKHQQLEHTSTSSSSSSALSGTSNSSSSNSISSNNSHIHAAVYHGGAFAFAFHVNDCNRESGCYPNINAQSMSDKHINEKEEEDSECNDDEEEDNKTSDDKHEHRYLHVPYSKVLLKRYHRRECLTLDDILILLGVANRITANKAYDIRQYVEDVFEDLYEIEELENVAYGSSHENRNPSHPVCMAYVSDTPLRKKIYEPRDFWIVERAILDYLYNYDFY
jgi:hypothetical protein